MERFVVGGSVRDRMLGLQPKDVDFVVVGATPEEMLAAGFKQVGADFPVFLDADGQEHALARTERKSGRGYNGFETNHSPDVTLEQDLERRDLTVNAMAEKWVQTGHETEGGTFAIFIVDPFNGQQDLKDKVLRHVSPAFADDPVRVLRLARFHARYGAEWTVAPETMEFCRQMVASGELDFLTRERVLAELEKALSEQAPHLFFSTLRECGALAVVFPELVNVATDTIRFFPSRSAKFNYAKLASLVENPQHFEARLNVSTEFRQYSLMFREATILRLFDPVDRLYKMDAFRKTALWEAVYADATAANFNLHFLQEAFEAVRHVCFETLPASAKQSLRGPDIAAAIKAQRRFAYETASRRK